MGATIPVSKVPVGPGFPRGSQFTQADWDTTRRARGSAVCLGPSLPVARDQGVGYTLAAGLQEERGDWHL